MKAARLHLGLALMVLALVASPAAARPTKRSKKKPSRARSSQPVKPDAAAPAPEPEPAKPAGTAEPANAARRESRIEFDERLVQGQTAAGAIYLFQRADSAFNSMIAPPASFRERTLRTVYIEGVPGTGGARP